ncbi:DUF421 domain-containing protein [Jannaschia sp. Os4]|uniref:DUF421 domain-containing protein n=1 Tax=Jannaschia sp. Os4 TaxID=2807617 RepID=UPI001939484A|nr:YetF domain-containing protein [Jannaschia sp. Os4]MBM2577250.1 DUF421 domain-containing protein [Jannaschia sp. Os4]
MPDIPDWLTPLTDAAILLPILLGVVRLTGLRSFAKMSAYDFAVTVAVGSILASVILDPATGWWMGALALAGLLGMQVVIGLIRARVPDAQRWIDNEPVVLLRDGVPDEAAMRAARVSADDLRQKLRQAGCAAFDDAALVVMETTGDVSVLRDGPTDDLVAEVRGA